MKDIDAATVRHGDFTGLAHNYSLHRPDYCPSVLSALIGLFQRKVADLDFVDVGAGTGIWTRMVARRGVHSTIAVEPNQDMRSHGLADNDGLSIDWRDGSAAATGLPTASCDWLTMASSFHWADFDAATAEFHRVLRQGGRFTALWNPRLIEENPLLVEIENHIGMLKPDIKRVSSGRSGTTETLTSKLWSSPYFEDVVYVEGRHTISMSPERYLGAWRSVNDLRFQLGPDLFARFLGFIEEKVSGLDCIATTYLTRAWSARRKG